MKKSTNLIIFKTCFLAACLIFLASCAGEEGEIGPTGPQGPTGPIGPIGQTGATGQNGADGEDADVIQYNYPSFTYSTTVTFTVPESTEVITESVVLAYAERSSQFWYPIPGWVVNTHEYRGYVSASNGATSVTFYMDRISGTGDQDFTAFRIIVIPAITVTNGRAAGVDYSNYEEVAAYYGLN